MIVGLTGSIGSGKSTVSKFLKEMGLKIYDADLIAKEILETEEIKYEIIKKIGKEFITPENIVDRKLLKKRVFSNKEQLEILNGLIHPKVIKYFKEIKEKYKDSNEIIVFDVALLFEVGLEKLCDIVIVIDIEPHIQIERVKKRDGEKSELIEKIIKSQMSREIRLKKADIIIENNEGLEELKNKIEKLVKKLKEVKK